jgi:serine phosphatase RsbU (regulator of sigma subunit)
MSEQILELLSLGVRERARLLRFSPRETIVREGALGAEAFVLLSGECEVTVHGEPINVLHPGELFGEIACFEGGVRTATVSALQDCEVLELPRAVLRDELAQSPAFLDRFLSCLALRFRGVSVREAAVRDEQRQLRRVLETLQPSLQRFHDHPLLSVEVRSQPLTFASGDYYDVLELSPGRFLFALGDVMGHGAPTAPIVGMVRGQLHELASGDARPQELLRHLHQHVRRHGSPDVFMTLSLLSVDLTRMYATISVAGPPVPLLYRHGRCAGMAVRSGWTLGYPFYEDRYEEHTFPLASGDILLLFTDGLSDAPLAGEKDTRLGVPALQDIVCRVAMNPAAGLADRIFKEVDLAQRGRSLDDDATALVVRIR